MNRIKQLRQANKVKQSDLAAAISVSPAALSGYETGKYEADIGTYKRIAMHFGVTLDYLLGNDMPPSNVARVPVLGNVAAGIPIEAITDILDYEEVDEIMARSGNLFGLRIRGASMEPRMQEGDVVIVRQQETANTGDTVVVMVNGDQATVKKIKYGPDGITLLPSNPAYDPMFYSAAEVESLPVRVIGKVIELRAKY